MLDAFRCRAFDEALEFASEAASLAPAEIAGLYAFYRVRIMEVLEAAPGEEWSPVLTLEEVRARKPRHSLTEPHL